MIRLLLIIIIDIAFILPTISYAVQIKQVSDGAETKVIISASELNRIKIIGDRIRSVKKNNGEFTVTYDDVVGDIYVRLDEPINDKPLNMFIVTEKEATYQLLLVPKDVPSEQIFIKDVAAQEISPNNQANIIDSYQQKLIDFYKLLANEGVDKDVIVTTSHENIKHREFIKLYLQKSYQGKGFVGNIYEVHNVSKLEVILEDQEFADNNTLLVSLSSYELPADGKAKLYIIRRE